jgi:hypothetical protein
MRQQEINEFFEKGTPNLSTFATGISEETVDGSCPLLFQGRRLEDFLIR